MLHGLIRHLKRQAGNRRRIVRLRPIRARLSERRELERIINEMVHFVYTFVPQLLEAYRQNEPREFDPARVFDSPASDIDRIIKLIVTQSQNVMARLELRIAEWAKKTDGRHRREFNAALMTGTGIKAETLLHPGDTDETVEAVVTRNVNLIRDVGDEARKRIGDIVIAGVTQRIPSREIARQLRDSEAMSLKRALLIATDQANKLNAALDRARQQAVGIDHFIWRHSGKIHYRPWHKERDGEIFAWDTNEIDPGDFPGEPPYCGCTAQAVLLDEDGNALEAFGLGEDEVEE